MRVTLSAVSTAAVVASTKALSSDLVDWFPSAKDLTRRKRALKLSFLPKSTWSVKAPGTRRLYDDEKYQSCDFAFTKCLPNDSCADCFEGLATEGVNWAAVTMNTPCTDVVKMLTDNGMCSYLENDQEALDVFCNTFNACAVWGDDEEPFIDDDTISDDEVEVDCSTLTKCEWDGKHQYFVGDGLCHDYSCYNTEVCEWDGGDCCQDTCKSTAFFECGIEKFACRDPKSADCDTDIGARCPENNSTEPKKRPDCESSAEVFELNEHDSWGDGWDKTVMTIADGFDDQVIFTGSLVDGHTGMEYLCLKKTCYKVNLKGGIWGNEVSWDITKNGLTIASGGAPMDCTFPVGGDFCENTCNRNQEKAKTEDDDYASMEEIYDCMDKKCVIQISVCKDDNNCAPCLVDDTPAFCFTNENYNALIDCAMCSCIDHPPAYCDINKKDKDSGSNSKSPQCTSSQTLAGASSIFSYSKCSFIDSVDAMISDWDENNFGALDTFEACSHSFNNDYAHGGKKALDCMRILANILDDSFAKEAVKELAEDLYKSGESFCDCAAEANKNAPNCKDFMHFKTSLYERLDACNALDEIDCAAWSEFHEPCKKKMTDEFGSINFSNDDQCNYIETGCGDTGPFPAFRRLDCGKEISKSAWDFYNSYSRDCLGDSPSPPSPSPPSPGPVPPPSPGPVPPPSPGPGPQPTPSPPGHQPNPTPKPYIPPVPEPKPSYNGDKKHHPILWMMFFSLVVGGVYTAYKRRTRSFDFVRYHQHRNYAPDDDDMGSSLTDTSSSWSFEPPNLPPTPSYAAPGQP